MISGAKHASNRQIERIRAIRGENNLRRFFSANEPGNCCPCRAHLPRNFNSLSISAAPGRGPVVAKIRVDRLVYFRRLGPTRGSVIQEDSTGTHKLVRKEIARSFLLQHSFWAAARNAVGLCWNAFAKRR